MIAMVLACLLLVSHARAQAPPVDRVAFAPRVGTLVPRDAAFVDEQGRRVTLADYVDDRPAIIVPSYFACSNLCSVVGRGVASSLARSDLVAGRDVQIVLISIDPLETAADALAKKRQIVGGQSRGWHFLVGGPESVRRVTDALGYRYVYDEQEHQYAHAAGIVITSPGGRIGTAMYGVGYPADALRAAVAGASAQVPTTEWLLCFHYDPATGRYSFAAMNAARAAALIALVALAVFMAWTRRA